MLMPEETTGFGGEWEGPAGMPAGSPGWEAWASRPVGSRLKGKNHALDCINSPFQFMGGCIS